MPNRRSVDHHCIKISIVKPCLELVVVSPKTDPLIESSEGLEIFTTNHDGEKTGAVPSGNSKRCMFAVLGLPRPRRPSLHFRLRRRSAQRKIPANQIESRRIWKHRPGLWNELQILDQRPLPPPGQDDVRMHKANIGGRATLSAFIPGCTHVSLIVAIVDVVDRMRRARQPREIQRQPAFQRSRLIESENNIELRLRRTDRYDHLAQHFRSIRNQDSVGLLFHSR